MLQLQTSNEWLHHHFHCHLLQWLPSNMIFVAACNPHRSCSPPINVEANKDDWSLGFYYVKPLHCTIEFLKLDYGALDSESERQYICATLSKKISMVKAQEADFILASAECKVRPHYAIPWVLCEKIRLFSFEWFYLKEKRQKGDGSRTTAMVLECIIIQWLKVNQSHH